MTLHRRTLLPAGPAGVGLAATQACAADPAAG
jgi:hypothetical protein